MKKSSIVESKRKTIHSLGETVMCKVGNEEGWEKQEVKYAVGTITKIFDLSDCFSYEITWLDKENCVSTASEEVVCNLKELMHKVMTG